MCTFVFKDVAPAVMYGVRRIWIDLENDVVWKHSGETATYTNWKDGEPQDASESCTVMLASGYWNDISCTKFAFQYVCEKVMS